jgi:hypothetical protein
MHAELSVWLRPVSEGETSVRLRGQMWCEHRLFSKLRGMLADQLEDHVVVIATKATRLAEQQRSTIELLHRRVLPESRNG